MPIKYFKFGDGTSRYGTMKDQTEKRFTVSERDLLFIKNGRSQAASLEPAAEPAAEPAVEAAAEPGAKLAAELAVEPAGV